MRMAFRNARDEERDVAARLLDGGVDGRPAGGGRMEGAQLLAERLLVAHPMLGASPARAPRRGGARVSRVGRWRR